MHIDVLQNFQFLYLFPLFPIGTVDTSPKRIPDESTPNRPVEKVNFTFLELDGKPRAEAVSSKLPMLPPGPAFMKN